MNFSKLKIKRGDILKMSSALVVLFFIAQFVGAARASSEITIGVSEGDSQTLELTKATSLGADGKEKDFFEQTVDNKKYNVTVGSKWVMTVNLVSDSKIVVSIRYEWLTVDGDVVKDISDLTVYRTEAGMGMETVNDITVLVTTNKEILDANLDAIKSTYTQQYGSDASFSYSINGELSMTSKYKGFSGYTFKNTVKYDLSTGWLSYLSFQMYNTTDDLLEWTWETPGGLFGLNIPWDFSTILLAFFVLPIVAHATYNRRRD